MFEDLLEDMNWPVFALLWGACLIGLWMPGVRTYFGIPTTIMVSLIMAGIVIVILQLKK